MIPRRLPPIGFSVACALAYAGAVVGYMPLLTLLLPIQVARIAGADRYAVLAMVLAVGSVAAGGANLLFGWLSDGSRRRGGGRRRWIAAGLVATLVSFAALSAARTPLAVVVAIAGFQVAINAALAPLMALIAEEVPEAQTGLTTGMFAAAAPFAALLSLALAAPFFPDQRSQLAVIGATATACLLPLLLLRPPAPAESRPIAVQRAPRRDLALAWAARLMMQIAGNVLFADLLYLMEERAGIDDAGATVARVGTLLVLGNLAPLPVAVLLGRWSDRRGRRTAALVAASALAALGLAAMAAASGWTGRAAGFLVFSVGWGTFLPLQVGAIMRLLPSADHRGRDLGIVNLTNTLPVLIGQALAWALVTPRHAERLLLLLAALTLAGGLVMLGIRGGGPVSRPPETR